MRARRDGDPRSGRRGDQPHRLAGRDRDRHRPRPREDRRRARPEDSRGARPRPDRAGCRFPGRLDRLRHHHARAGRLRHDRGRIGRGARRGGLRDLHGRRGRLHRRPAARAGGAQAARGQLRRDARAGRLGREGAAGTLGRDRAQPPRQAARPPLLLAGGRHLDSRGGRSDAREGAHLRSHAHARGDALPRRGHDRLAAVRGAGGRERERRHDRPDRPGDRLLGARRRPRRGLRGARRARTSSGARATTSAR